VAAIYGRKGAEMADIELPSGQMITVAAGAQIESYRVSDINAAGIEIVGFAPSRTGQGDAPGVAGKVPARASARAGSKTAAAQPPSQAQPAESMEVRKRIPLGGTFD
jgi:hypothetical protein